MSEFGLPTLSQPNSLLFGVEDNVGK